MLVMKEHLNTHIVLSTHKGLIWYTRGPRGWRFVRDEFRGLPVSMTEVSASGQHWWAALAHKHWGQKLHRSQDGGHRWEAAGAPEYPAGEEAKPGVPARLRYIWSMARVEEGGTGRLYVGTEPGGLFVSEDEGLHFELVRALWQHPSRPKHWFGGGRNFAGIHSIVVDPRDPAHLYVGVSCAGVFETTDAGQHWQVRNQGLRADYLPDPYVAVGHDPHRVLLCAHHPEVMWQQNHCGIFRSTNGGRNWQDVTDLAGLADYGFALAVDDHRPERAWVIPAVSDRMRVAVDQSLCVCRTEDGGKSWEALRSGLPQGAAYDIVFRHALAKRGPLMAFGTTTGNLFVSENEGDHWTCLNHHLPQINAVHIVQP